MPTSGIRHRPYRATPHFSRSASCRISRRLLPFGRQGAGVVEDEPRAVVPVTKCMMALVLLDVMLERAKYQG